MKAFFWSAGEDGCSWYRMHLPAAALAARGHHTHASQTYTDRWDDADVIVGQRIANPGPSAVWQQWSAAGRRLVFDVDDHYFAFDPTNREAAEFYGQPDVIARMRDNIAAAALVTCATPRLAQVMAEYNPNVAVVPNGLPAGFLDWPARHRNQGTLTIGWAGSQSTVHELPLAAEALRRLIDRQGMAANLSLHLVGVPREAATWAGLDHILARVTPWIPHTVDYLRAIDFDIWVAPYRPTEFNQAKVPTKALEAAFLGIPIVASDTEPYRQFVRHGETGLLVRKPGDWSTHIRRLIADPGLRERMGKAAREQAYEHTLDHTAAAWEAALTGVPA